MKEGSGLRRLGITVALCLGTQALMAGDPISGVAARIENEQRLKVSARVDFPVNEAIEKAVQHGVPLVLLTEVELERGRPWLWDEELGRIVRRSELRYHALSGRYLLRSEGEDRIENFRNLEEALRRHGELSGVPLALDEPYRGAIAPLRVAVRGRMEARELPLLVRLLPSGKTEWTYDSGWQYFPVGPAP